MKHIYNLIVAGAYFSLLLQLVGFAINPKVNTLITHFYYLRPLIHILPVLYINSSFVGLSYV